MEETTKHLVDYSNATFGYTQSDEISLLLTDYKTINTQPWFEYKLQKIVSLAASIATAHFNDEFEDIMFKYSHKGFDPIYRTAYFDARAFNIPKEEVVNYFIWRQQDCTRNSIQMVGRANFSEKELHKKSCDDIQEMLWSQKQINWNDIETHKKRGTAVYKTMSEEIVDQKDTGWDVTFTEEGDDIKSIRTSYYIDKQIHIFTQDRHFIQKWVETI
jgi:tRNA(His) 5'-end guanylyltransferase